MLIDYRGVYLQRKLFSENIRNRDFETRVRAEKSFCTVILVIDKMNYTKSAVSQCCWTGYQNAAQPIRFEDLNELL